MESKLLKTSDFVTRLALVTHCLFQSGFVSASLLPLSFGFAMRLALVKYFAFVMDCEWLNPLLFVKLSTLVNWSDCLIHLKPAKYFAFAFLKPSLSVNPITMENQLAPATQFELLKLLLLVSLSD